MAILPFHAINGGWNEEAKSHRRYELWVSVCKYVRIFCMPLIDRLNYSYKVSPNTFGSINKKCRLLLNHFKLISTISYHTIHARQSFLKDIFGYKFLNAVHFHSSQMSFGHTQTHSPKGAIIHFDKQSAISWRNYEVMYGFNRKRCQAKSNYGQKCYISQTLEKF